MAGLVAGLAAAPVAAQATDAQRPSTFVVERHVRAFVHMADDDCVARSRVDPLGQTLRVIDRELDALTRRRDGEAAVVAWALRGEAHAFWAAVLQRCIDRAAAQRHRTFEAHRTQALRVLDRAIERVRQIGTPAALAGLPRLESLREEAMHAHPDGDRLLSVDELNARRASVTAVEAFATSLRTAATSPDAWRWRWFAFDRLREMQNDAHGAIGDAVVDAPIPPTERVRGGSPGCTITEHAFWFAPGLATSPNPRVVVAPPAR